MDGYDVLYDAASGNRGKSLVSKVDSEQVTGHHLVQYLGNLRYAVNSRSQLKAKHQ